MSRQDFLDSVWLARNLRVHARGRSDLAPAVAQDSEGPPPRAPVWLTPKSVAGFEGDDFRELGPDRQRELAEAVAEFLAVAQQVPPTAPATPDQVSQAAAALTKLFQILAPYDPTFEESRKVERAIESLELPDWVESWNFRLDKDWADDPSVRVTLYMDERIAPRNQWIPTLKRLTSSLVNALSSLGISRFPYIGMSPVSEHKSMV
jgi:hypothetical protein